MRARRDLRRLLWPLLYAVVALVVAGPLLAPGYVFALDHAVGPRSAEYYGAYVAHNQDAISSKGAYAVLLGALDALLPMWLVQKLLLFAPFFLAGYGAHRLAKDRAGASDAAAVFAGLLFALSPFAYLRGVSGQTGVLWAYALMPWFLRAWIEHTRTGSRRALAASVLLVAATLVFQAHGVLVLVLLVGLHTLVRLARAPRAARAWAERLRAPLALAAWSLVVNAYWLVPVLLAPETTLSRIGEGDRAFFATTDAGLPSVGAAALTLQGFWREGYASPFPIAALLVVPALVLLLAVHGTRERRADDAALALAIAGALGVLLAVGDGSRLTSWLTSLVWEHVPFMRGFRDAHKMLALLALAYAYLAPAGMDALLGAVRAAARRTRAPRALPLVAVALLLAAPVATATPLLNGYAGQLGVAEYPDAWARVEGMTAGCDGEMLVLPWHLYLDASWIPNDDKRIAQPAKLFFTCPVLSSDDLELGDAASQASTPQTAYVDRWMDALDAPRAGAGAPPPFRTLGNLLAPVGVQYVLLLKESDWRKVAADLDAQEDLRLVHDEPGLRLYENAARVVTAPHLAEVVRVASLDELVPLSASRALADVAVVVGPEDAAETGALPREVVVATPPARAAATSWRLGSASPLFLSAGVAPAFDPSIVGGDGAGAPRLRDAGLWWSVALWTASVLAAASAYLYGRTPPDHSTKYPEEADGHRCS